MKKKYMIRCDMEGAKSVVWGMKLHLLKKQGKTKIPRGWALNKEGKVTENLEEALGELLLMPVGGYKGSGLALVKMILDCLPYEHRGVRYFNCTEKG